MTPQELQALPLETRVALQEQKMGFLVQTVHELSDKLDKLNEKMTRIIAVVAVLAGGSGIGLGAFFGG